MAGELYGMDENFNVYPMCGDFDEIVHTDLVLRWADLLEQHRHVGWHEFEDPKLGTVKVSTVFLGLDHGWGGGPPLLFETMIFADEAIVPGRCWRYSTYEEAKAGHLEVVAMVEERLKQTRS